MAVLSRAGPFPAAAPKSGAGFPNTVPPKGFTEFPGFTAGIASVRARPPGEPAEPGAAPAPGIWGAWEGIAMVAAMASAPAGGEPGVPAGAEPKLGGATPIMVPLSLEGI